MKAHSREEKIVSLYCCETDAALLGSNRRGIAAHKTQVYPFWLWRKASAIDPPKGVFLCRF